MTELWEERVGVRSLEGHPSMLRIPRLLPMGI